MKKRGGARSGSGPKPKPPELLKVQYGTRLAREVVACIRAQDNQVEYLERLVRRSKEFKGSVVMVGVCCTDTNCQYCEGTGIPVLHTCKCVDCGQDVPVGGLLFCETCEKKNKPIVTKGYQCRKQKYSGDDCRSEKS